MFVSSLPGSKIYHEPGFLSLKFTVIQYAQISLFDVSSLIYPPF